MMSEDKKEKINIYKNLSSISLNGETIPSSLLESEKKDDSLFEKEEKLFLLKKRNADFSDKLSTLLLSLKNESLTNGEVSAYVYIGCNKEREENSILFLSDKNDLNDKKIKVNEKEIRTIIFSKNKRFKERDITVIASFLGINYIYGIKDNKLLGRSFDDKNNILEPIIVPDYIIKVKDGLIEKEKLDFRGIINSEAKKNLFLLKKTGYKKFLDDFLNKNNKLIILCKVNGSKLEPCLQKYEKNVFEIQNLKNKEKKIKIFKKRKEIYCLIAFTDSYFYKSFEEAVTQARMMKKKSDREAGSESNQSSSVFSESVLNSRFKPILVSKKEIITLLTQQSEAEVKLDGIFLNGEEIYDFFGKRLNYILEKEAYFK